MRESSAAAAAAAGTVTVTAAEIIGGNDDILTEILSQLPIKQLLRLKSVNKQFSSLISERSFCLIHSLGHPNPPPSALFLLLPLSSSPSFSFLPLYSTPLPPPPPPPPSLNPCYLLQSCNGLLLFRPHSAASPPPPHILLFNPTTRWISVIPQLPDHFDSPVHIPIRQEQLLVSNPTTHIPIGQGQEQMLLSNPTTHIPIGQGQEQMLLSNPTIGQGQELVSNPITHIPIGQQQLLLSNPITHISIGQGQLQEPQQVVLSDHTMLFDTGNSFDQGLQNGQVEGIRELVGLNLAFDPARWAHYYLITVFKDYQDDGDGNRFSIAVYGSNTRVWRDRIVWLDDAPFDVEFRRGVYWRGRVFWLSHTGSTVYYDVDNELVGRLVLPKVFDEDTYLERFRYFGECCGHLHLIEIRTNCVREFDVLELEENDGGILEWVVRFKVDLDVVGRMFQNDMFQDGVDRFGRRLRFYALSILAVIRDNGDGANDDTGDALVLSIPGKVISYSFKSRVSRLLCNVVDESDKWLPFRGYNAFQFIESLYRP